MRKILLILLLLGVSPIWARYVAFLTETASGGNINSQKDIVTMKNLLGEGYDFIIFHQKEATSTNIRAKFKELAKELTPNDTFVFYYSGHGDRFARGDSREPDHRDDFLCTSDLEYITDTKITNVLLDDELNYLYSKIKARKIIIIDACHSATMDKGVRIDNIKQFKSRKGFVTRGFSVKKKWREAKNRNFLHFGAADENESARGSINGGIFTLTLAKVIQEKGDISFAQLEREIQNRIKGFRPSISPKSDIDKSSLSTKDIFAIPKQHRKPSTTLASLLQNKAPTIRLETHQEKVNFALNDKIDILSYLNPSKSQYLYLIELKDEDTYKIISTQPNCIKYSKYGYNQTCQFRGLKATKPTGVSNIYLIKTSKPLNLGNSKDSIITNDFLDNAGISLFEQLKSSSFEVGKIKIKIK